MPKITFIGAGSLVFTRNLCSDILLAPRLQDCTINLMDIDPQRLEQSRQIAQSIADRRKLPAKIEATTDRRNTGWNNVSAIRSARAVYFGRSGLSRSSSIFVLNWTILRRTPCS